MRTFQKATGFVGSLLFLASVQPGSAAAGDEHWDVQFGYPGTTNTLFALTLHEGRIYGSGYFAVPQVSTNTFIEIWDGTRWNYVPGLQGSLCLVYDIAFFRGEMYVAGTFSTAGGGVAPGLARWNGTSWSNVGGFAGAVFALASDGSDLYVGGTFTNAGGALVTNVARWNGSAWFALGGGLGLFNAGQQGVSALTFHQGRLLAGGRFDTSGAATVRNLASWDGVAWTELGGGTGDRVNALASAGADLYVGGAFTNAGGAPVSRIAKWNGSAWSALGNGVSSDVRALAVSGELVYAGGDFTTAGSITARRFAIWNGSTWSATGGSGVNGTVSRIRVLGTNVYVGGEFIQADDILVNHLAIWDGVRWSGVGPAGRLNGVAGTTSAVRAVATDGLNFYAGGIFTGVGPVAASRVARFDGTNWRPMGSGMSGTNGSTTGSVNALAVGGGFVYAGGSFTNAGGVTARSIARWDGSAWSALGAGVPGLVSAIAVRGTEVFVGGTFTLTTPTGTAFNVARWDGLNWSSLPGASFAGLINNFTVNALAVSGTDVFIGGNFFAGNFAGERTTNVVRHNGTDWMPVGQGVNSNVNAIAIVGTDVWVGGRFSSASGVPASRIARWNGSAWSAPGGGVFGSGNFFVSALGTIGDHVYAAGNFTTAGAVEVNRIARWDGTNWSALGSGVSRVATSPSIACLATRGNDLLVGGNFDYAGGKASYYLARWNDQIDFDFVPTLRLADAAYAPGLGFRCRVLSAGVPGYVVERSSDLRQWRSLATNTAPAFLFQDPGALALPHSVYRVRQGP